jgi:hypothetical protein
MPRVLAQQISRSGAALRRRAVSSEHIAQIDVLPGDSDIGDSKPPI